jgi:hypothetical protein
MKRRVLAAVLPVAAFVVLAGVGEATSATGEIGATKGRPWTGPPGVRVSVAELMKRQRAQDRRIGAKPQGVREKPEPPEEAGAPAEEEGESGSKRPGPAVPQLPQRAAGEAVGPLSSLTADTSFLGAQLSESGFIPPDSMGSVSPTQALVDVNGRIKVFSKTGTLGGLNVSDSVFWSSVSNGFEPTDPGVEYDRLSGRWIVSAVNVENSNNRVMIAVSNSSTITSSSSFTFFFFNQNVPPPAGDDGAFADYPQLGVDKNAVYIGVNEFNGLTTTAFVIRKSSLLGVGPIVVTAFRNLAPGGAGPWSPQPATDMDPNVNEGYIVGADQGSFSQLDVRRISDPGGTPTISGNFTVPVPATVNPEPVPQGSHGNLDPLDDRLFEAMISRKPNGSLSLWTAHNIEVNSSGVASSTGGRDADRWYELGTLSTTPSLIQSGTLFDSAASSPRYFWIPSIAANGQGHASLNSSTAGSGFFAQVASSGHLASDAAGLTEPFDITQTSSSSYQVGQANPKRWGDYSQTVVDPTDNQTFWTFQEYADATNSWGVRVIKLKAPPPATPSGAAPSTLTPSQPNQTVQITGTQTNGSGFFDPGPDSGGPGYPNHISASVSGGVTVNSVTYTDPTHVTLNVTTGASQGPKDVTITNPDGQSSTGSNLLNVGNDVTPPAPPTLTSTNPASPANNNSPKILGSAESGSTVQLYTSSNCTTGLAGSGDASTFASPGITATPQVAENSTTTFYATATDASNNTSDCSSTLPSNGSITYIEDSSSPAAPTSLASSPVGPANDNSPEISGTAEVNSSVRVYKAPATGDCTPVNLAAGPNGASSFASPGMTVSVSDNTSTVFRATATDAAGNTSPCSSSSATYVEDSNIPAAPTITATNPTSPSNSSTTPLVQGTASADTVNVDVYTQSGCAGSPVTGSKSLFEGSGIQVTVSANQTTQLSARARDTANNLSACSSNFPYTHDNIAPAQPSSLGTSPASPANNNSPLVTGSAELGSTVRVYKAPTALDCTISNQVSMGDATTFGSPGLSGGSVGNNSNTTYRATATDAAGNPSGCSSASVTYVEDSAAPAEPSSLASSPAGPANDNFPEIGGSAEAGSTVRVYRAPTVLDCTIGNLASTGDQATFQPPGPGLTVSVADNSTTTFRTTATDAANNASPCSSSSVTYIESTPSGGGGGGGGGGGQPPPSQPPPGPSADSSAPETTITAGPKKTRKRRPSFSFASSEAGSSFQCQLDSGPFQPCNSPFRPARKLKLGKHKLKVEAIDPANNVDASPAVRKFKVVPPS